MNFGEEKPVLPLPTRRWLKPDEAAGYLGVSVPTLKVLGVEPSRKLGKQTPRYDILELDQAMADELADQEAEQDG